MSAGFAGEARRAWTEEVRRRTAPELEARLGALIVATGLVAGGLATWHMALATAPSAWPGLALSGLLGALVMVGVPAGWLAGARRRAAAAVAAARARAGSVECPRCAAPLLARGPDAGGRRACGACAAPLLEAEGLLVVAIDDARVRRARWRAAARHRLRRVPRVSPLGPVAWLGTTALALALVGLGARAVGAAEVPEPLEPDEPEAHGEGTARARGDHATPSALGPPTRPRAPLELGTQVLARQGAGPWHRLAVIVGVREVRAYVVFADGEAGWIAADAALAPELAIGDRVEREDGERLVPGEITARLGPAVRIGERWTSVARVRVRGDAPHAAGTGRVSEVPADAWIEIEERDGAWRPGILVEVDGPRVRVASSGGDERWLAHTQVRGQRIGPGTRVWIDGDDAPHVVAARIGDALAVVDAHGARRWTALGRVVRR